MNRKEKWKNKLMRSVASVLMCFSVAAAVAIGAADYAIPQSSRLTDTSQVGGYPSGVEAGSSIEGEVTAKVLGIPLKSIEVDVIPQKGLIPCGSIFGVKFFTKGVLVVGMSDVESTEGILNPAYKAGLRVGDVILKIGGNDVNTVEEIAQRVDECGGEMLNIEYERDGMGYSASILPIVSLADGKYKTGLWVRDSTAGIGTVTYYDPETGDFGGLGHGICDVDTGKLMPMLRGNVVDITVTDIVKGINGEPGEIKGSFGNIKRGILYSNTEEGVFGNFAIKPECAFTEPVEVASSNEVCEGEAFIYASFGDSEIKKYKVELTRIYRNGSETKNFIFKVTDSALLERTGGIVQGMSGSPIVQNGKLIGAVTHVLVNDPTKGYGIFIENMLKASGSNMN